MSRRKSILVDADAFVALAYEKDSNHQRAKKIKAEIDDLNLGVWTINLVLHEVITVLSHRINQNAAKKFYFNFAKNNPQIIFVNEDLEEKSYQIFLKETKKGTSFTDCANIAVMRALGLDSIFAFDKVYKQNGFKRIGLDDDA
jgi:predicted nucleic acid-binding protein